MLGARNNSLTAFSQMGKLLFTHYSSAHMEYTKYYKNNKKYLVTSTNVITQLLTIISAETSLYGTHIVTYTQ